ncbi:hypothetical protein Hanom_Chr11g00984411 [Helianthus anomalus]
MGKIQCSEKYIDDTFDHRFCEAFSKELTYIREMAQEKRDQGRRRPMSFRWTTGGLSN